MDDFISSHAGYPSSKSVETSDLFAGDKVKYQQWSVRTFRPTPPRYLLGLGPGLVLAEPSLTVMSELPRLW